MAPLSPIDARSIVAATLKRALHGPTGTRDTRWPGDARAPIVVTSDQPFESFDKLNEAMINLDGQEVLRFRPSTVYGVGVLFPQLTEDQEDALTIAQDEELTAQPEDFEAADNIPEPSDEPDVAEDTVAVPDGGNRPRSIAMTFHVPAEVDEIIINITGGRYRPLPVVVGVAPIDLWQREPVSEVITASPRLNSRHQIAVEGLQLDVGVDSRPSPRGFLVTVYLANTGESSGELARHCLFQAQISVEASSLHPYPTAAIGDRDSTFDLLYRKHPVEVIGHGTDAIVEKRKGRVILHTETMPIVDLPATTPDVSDDEGILYEIGMQDLAALNAEARIGVQRLITDYQRWINSRSSDAELIKQPELLATARRHLAVCQEFLSDVESGWALVQSDPEVAQCLSWASQVMDDQRAAATTALRVTTVKKSNGVRHETVEGSPPSRRQNEQSFWRPFQIAFILAAIPPAVNPNHPARERVDIIWMPTGGGKTEAYLGLSAFTMLWLRRQRVLGGQRVEPSVDVMMRYTLRLLTTQQVQRAAALICAMELLRQSAPDLLGTREFRIGAFLGGGSTPNTRKDATSAWNRLDANPRAEGAGQGFLLNRCPWCGAQMGVVPTGVAGYRKIPMKNGDTRVVACCPSAACPFAFSGDPLNPGGLPVLEVDEDIYSVPPTFLVGTIDKFAQLAWKPKARSLFGLRLKQSIVERIAEPPALLIQDELHLIAGPLGSLDALYEVTIQELCKFSGGRTPRVIAATATTKDFEKQVLRLYGRESARLVPPPGLDVDDSFFSRTDRAMAGKTYAAVCAPGYGSNVQAQMRVLAALNHAAGVLDQLEANPDPWWTNLAFFSSRRSLGLQLSACQTGLDNAIYAMSRLSGVRVGRLTEKGTRLSRRTIGQVKELTATSRDNVTQLLAQLDVSKDMAGCVDLCFATSMIEVGVDVPRLGLMTVMGQPKSYSQYIQVTGRVGRSARAPGLVVVVLSRRSVRDRSHYETFTSSHHRLYAAVEPVSITPFTPQALERGLAGAVSGLIRPTTSDRSPNETISEESLSLVLQAWQDRARLAGGEQSLRPLTEESVRLLRLANAAFSGGVPVEWDDYRSSSSQSFLRPTGNRPSSLTLGGWQVPQSMRSVDAEAGVVIPKEMAGFQARPTRVDDEVEDF